MNCPTHTLRILKILQRISESVSRREVNFIYNCYHKDLVSQLKFDFIILYMYITDIHKVFTLYWYASRLQPI